MDWLGSFIEMDNHSALEVCHMRKAPRPFEVQRPKFRRNVKGRSG